ncbi:hypothetical protein, partial [Bacillus pumilus]|uniref:hypothetical protein n=1 Tax=Bacillus pumilus TaxID=1408 RepID=UPI0011A2BFAA
PHKLYHLIYHQTQNHHQQLLTLVKEITVHPEPFSQQQNQNINPIHIPLQTPTHIFQNLITPHTQISILLTQPTIHVHLTKP